MIKEIRIENFCKISHLQHASLGFVNLVIGPNQSGKTTLLKALYAAMKTVELHKRGKDIRSDKEILSEKLYWTFQCRSLGNLVKKGTSSLSFSIISNEKKTLSYSLGTSTTKFATISNNTFPPTDVNSVFIPAKEVLSLRDIILDSRNRYAEFGFDDTYFDLAKALTPTTKGKNYKTFSDARKRLEEMVGGKLDYHPERKEWLFKDANKREYEVALTSEGVKKLSILDLLLGNRYLSDHSVVLIDEVEANLHPSLVSKFLEIVMLLAKTGVQFFIASHSYFVIKRMYILAHQMEMHIPVLSFDAHGAISVGDLSKNMSKNAIIDEAVSLYKDEVSL